MPYKANEHTQSSKGVSQFKRSPLFSNMQKWNNWWIHSNFIFWRFWRLTLTFYVFCVTTGRSILEFTKLFLRSPIFITKHSNCTTSKLSSLDLDHCTILSYCTYIWDKQSENFNLKKKLTLNSRKNYSW